ncbi:MAG TPA: hypothetical protein PLJ42_06240 [Chitinophagales bacterium]|jgi:hypothetical protein|nr:hypothetical protein [Chitinophagales bacterium]HQV78594.1 hypothetical protein [Chitinophagales bacterium]HQW79020.1 hypothetical protein [Chitinophagales bacterium]HRB18950.1 hypothetical protein [Chitinophagales bacterium]HRB69446.1 hypothetical protein [Chitinophagales bacterium]
MKQLFTLFLFICSLTAQAQDVNGTWVGNFVQYIHNRYDVELVVEKLAPGNIFSARLRVMDDYYFGEYNVSGFICNKKYLEITTIVLLRESGPANWIDCLNGTFDLNDDETVLSFTDTWLLRDEKNNACKVKYIQKDMFQCLRSAYLHKAKYQSEIAAFDTKWNSVAITRNLNKKALDEMLANTKPTQKKEPAPILKNDKLQDTITSMQPKVVYTTPEPSTMDFTNSETKIVAKNEDRAPIIDTFEQIQTRPVVIKDELEVSQKEITIEYWDRYNEDGDSINLYLNKKPILKNVLLTKAKKTIIINLEQEVNYLVLDAINQGTEPPNTASITIKDGKKIQNVSLTSNLRTSGALKIVYKKPVIPK